MSKLRKAVKRIANDCDVECSAIRIRQILILALHACPPKQKKWRKEKKWQRKGGKIRHVHPNYTAFVSHSWAFSSTTGTYEIAPTTRAERLKNLNDYQDTGGKVERKPSHQKRWRQGHCNFTNPTAKYRKVAKF